jgi:hypothetical protein
MLNFVKDQSVGNKKPDYFAGLKNLDLGLRFVWFAAELFDPFAEAIESCRVYSGRYQDDSSVNQNIEMADDRNNQNVCRECKQEQRSATVYWGSGAGGCLD